MLPPALMAQRLLTGGGLTVLLAWAFGLQSGRTTLEASSSGTMVFLLGAVMIAAGVALAQGAPQLTRLFPTDGDEAMAGRLKQDMAELEKQEQSSRAWARLEADALREALDEEA
ncbi:MAG: hypothetical protein VYC27_02945 [Candidatus Thermoplasmatota archaeon]|jgi:hypothetical protein|nr:hypothetical protein [Euryarchaeota archaeon]MEE2666581.1 hypothetical protein [Candidatus Thermoplasmatota archaeon]